nr:hypothetical protein [Tanacetum cinerariifolium]
VVVSAGGADPADVVVSAGGADPADVVVSAGGADPADVVVSASGVDHVVVVSTGGADPAVVISAGGADPAIVISAGDADFAGTFISAGVSVATGPSVAFAPSSPIRDPAKGKAIATPSSPRVAEEQEREIRASAEQSIPRQAELDRIALNLTNEEWIGLVDQVWANLTLSAELLGADVSEDTFSHRTNSRIARNYICFCWCQLAACDPISAVPSVSVVPSVFAAFSIPAETPIAAGVSTTASVFESASVPIIDLLDSPPKATSLPLDPKTTEQAIPLRKSLRKKSMARRRTLSRSSQSESVALPFDEDDPKSKFKKYLRQVFDDDEPAEPVSLSLRFSTLRELMHWVGRADLMVLYGMVLDKYKIERATGIGLGLVGDLIWRFYALPAIHVLETETGGIMYVFVDKKYPILPATIQRMPNHGLEIDRDPSGNDLTTAIQLIQSLLNQLHPATRIWLVFVYLFDHQSFNSAKYKGFKDVHGASSSTFTINMLLLLLLAALLLILTLLI